MSQLLMEFADALYKAKLIDLPMIPCTMRVFDEVACEYVYKDTERHHGDDDLEITMFQQEWSNTATGLNKNIGVAGQAFTSCHTIVIESKLMDTAAIYFRGRLAYIIPTAGPRYLKAFLKWVETKNFPDQMAMERIQREMGEADNEPN